MSSAPASFCTICTNCCKQELVGFLMSLSFYHPCEPVYIICDDETRTYITSTLSIQPKLNMIWLCELNAYTSMTRATMESMGIWGKFQATKANAMIHALTDHPDTLFIDCDTIILDRLCDIDKTKTLGVSPQFIKEQYVQKTGYYNGGLLWTNDINVPTKWIEYTKTSRYFDQASIEDLVNDFSHFEFGENYNLQSWRFYLGLETFDKVSENISVKDGCDIFYKDKPLKFIHTHFNSPRFDQVNKIFKYYLTHAKRYKELLCIDYVEHGHWTITIPKQPLVGLYHHKNDSFRELTILLKTKNADLNIVYDAEKTHCWLGTNILLYDRPTTDWINKECNQSLYVLMGNGDEEEINKIRKSGAIVSPWIFWARRPMVLEKLLNNKGVLDYDERSTNVVFIGNCENNIQSKYRTQSKLDWKSVVDEYYCTNGAVHVFTQLEYLNKLRESKYGLCLRGYGKKCHREIELMAFGTVPIITPDVSVTYADKLIKNVHYLEVKSPDKLQQTIFNITKDQWQTMSENCKNWYNKNINSTNCWTNMLNIILYDNSDKIL